MSMGNLKEIKMDIKTCPSCRIAYYPDLYSKGLFPLHNKFLLSYDLLMDVNNLLVTGSSLVENITEKMMLLGKCDKVSEEAVRTNISNNAKNIERVCIALIAALGMLTNIYLNHMDLQDFQMQFSKFIANTVCFLE